MAETSNANPSDNNGKASNNNNNDGDVSKRSSFNSKDSGIYEETNPRTSSKKNSILEQAVLRNNSKETLLQEDRLSRTSVKGSSHEDLLSQTTQSLARFPTQKGRSFSEDAVRGKKTLSNESRKNEIHGFVLVSWKIRQFSVLEKALRPGKCFIFVIFILFIFNSLGRETLVIVVILF